MNKWLRNLLVLVLIIVFLMAFSSSYTALSMDNLAYVLAIGIDTSTQNKLQVSFQFSSPSSTAESGSTQKPPTYINTVHASSLSDAINLMNSYMGRQLNLSHCKMIIFSEDLANLGISDEIYTLMNDTQIRPSANILVTKCDTKTYLEQTEPQLENLLSKYYEFLTNSSKYTGYMPNATLGDFFNSMVCYSCDPSAMLGGLSDQYTNPEHIGLAVFKDDKLVGELNAIETISYLTIKNNVDRFLVSVPDPYHSDSYLDIYLSPENSTHITVNTDNGAPYITIKLKLSGQIYSATSSSDFSDPAVLEQISSACNSYIEKTFSDFLYKTAKEFKSDICGLGRYALSNFLTTEQFKKYNWLESYKDSFFEVKVDTSVKSSMVILKT